MNAGANLEPRARDDDGVHERPLHAVEDKRLVPLVDDAQGDEHHARADVERTRDQEIEIGLFELELAGLFEPFNEGVLELELTDETDPGREAD